MEIFQSPYPLCYFNSLPTLFDKEPFFYILFSFVILKCFCNMIYKKRIANLAILTSLVAGRGFEPLTFGL